MKKSDFWYELPPELIAQNPRERGSSKLMVLDRASKEIKTRVFFDVLDYIKPKDCLVLNNTKVIRAKLKTFIDEKKLEITLIEPEKPESKNWLALCAPSKRAKVGVQTRLGELLITIKEIREDGFRLIELDCDGALYEILDKVGEIPLPRYIKNSSASLEDYQTVYAKKSGSVAAPTAGLHFNNQLLSAIKQKGADIAEITLRVGPGTFRPVRSEDIREHKMHKEAYEISEKAANKINNAKEKGGRIIAVGTTSIRVLETASPKGVLEPQTGETSIFIYPGYEFKIADALITNFHLPESTLIMLVSAFAGREFVLEAYQKAIAQGFLFYSFGDAMLII